jgi:uncharacterized metal-binding protein YceD (DUF177 family)
MKIYIKDIRPEGISVRYQIPADTLGLTREDYLQFIRPIDVDARVERVDNTVLSKMKVKGRYKSFCCRTLVDVERDWSHEFMLDFEIDKTTEFIDMDEDIRQEIILGLPLRVLCDEELAREKDVVREGPLDESPAGPQSKQKTYKPFENLKFKEE